MVDLKKKIAQRFYRRPASRARDPTPRSARRARASKLNTALLLSAGLFDRYHMPLHLPQLGGDLFIAGYQERSRPEDDDGGRRGYSIIRVLSS